MKNLRKIRLKANIMKMNEKKNIIQNKKLTFAILIGLLLLVTTLALLFGGTKLSIEEVIGGLFGTSSMKINIIVRQVRLPRVFGALLAGVGLSISGVLLQGVTDNGLASPNIIGVNSGAGLATIITLSFFPKAVYALPFVAFFGAFVTTILIIYISSKIGMEKITVVLAGMALTTILNAGISFFSLLDSDVSVIYNYFSVGGLSGVTTEKIMIPFLLILGIVLLALWLSSRIAILCLGDSLASSLGVNVGRLRMICLICASGTAASVVSFAGLLGFVGLIVPHIARKLSNGNMKDTLIISAFVGAILVILADMIGRTLFAPTEIPVGIVMALIGAPFFLWLLFSKKGK